MRRSAFAGLLLLALTFTLAARLGPPALADSPTSMEQRELSIERGLACPQCTDLPLDVCDQDICNDMRAIIHEKVQAGESDASIRAYFVERYGSRVLLAPPKDPADLFAWIFPFLALAAGAAIALAFIRTLARRPRPPVTAGASPALQRYRAQIERDVEGLE